MNAKRIGTLVIAAVLSSGILASTALADGPSAPPSTPPVVQPSDHTTDMKQLRQLIAELRKENKQERQMRTQLHRDVKEIRRLVKLSKQAQVTEDLKAAYAEVDRLKDDLKIIRETHRQWVTEWAVLRDYVHQKHLDLAIAQAGKLKGILELQIDQLQSANARAHKLVSDLRTDLINVGINPDGV